MHLWTLAPQMPAFFTVSASNQIKHIDFYTELMSQLYDVDSRGVPTKMSEDYISIHTRLRYK